MHEMTEKELYQIANKFYHKEGAELDAIANYKKLLESYPNNIDGWADLSTMQYSICDYDASIRSSIKMIELDRTHSWNIKNFVTKLNLLKKLTFSEPDLYLDESTREAFKISELTGKSSLCDLIEKYTLKLIELEPNNLKNNYKYHFSLATMLIKNNRFNNAINHLNRAFELKEHKVGRIDDTPNIYNWISTAYAGLRNFPKAIECIDLAFESGLDEFQMLKKADIYLEKGDEVLYERTIEEFIKIAEKKMSTKPEPAYVNQKITALLKLKQYSRAENALQDFEALKPYNDYAKQNIQRIKKQIEEEKNR